MPAILMTRPEILAKELTIRLQRAGFSVLPEPLLSFEPRFTPCPVVFADGVIAVTSRLAFLALAARRGGLDPSLTTRPCYVVGARTAQEARALGFQDVREGSGDGAALAALLRVSEAAGTMVLHPCGEDVAPGFREAVQEAGLNLAEWIVYKAEAASGFSREAEKALKTGEIDAALFFSARTAQTFRDLMGRAGLASFCAEMCAVGLSEAALSPVRALPWRRVLVAEKPTEDAVAAALSLLTLPRKR